MSQPLGVFVYGTLKQGEHNFATSQQGGWVRSERAWIEGFALYGLPRSAERPYPYPALVRGEGRVWGEVQYFADLDRALVLLDELEEMGAEYLRLPTQAFGDHGVAIPVWVYVYLNPGALEAAGGVWLPEGSWTGTDRVS